MQKKILKYILICLLILLVFIIHQSFLLPLNWRFNFWPAIFVFILFVFNYKAALLWGISLGFLLDHFSPLFFGTHLIILYLIISILYLLTQHLITNRSILSVLILTFLSTLIYNGLLFFIFWLAVKLAGFEKILIINLNTIIVQLLANLILVFILFVITSYFSKKINTKLLIK